MFALANKLISSGQYERALELFSANLRTIKFHHRHIVMYNIAKLYQMNGDVPRSIFQYESLLKETGSANDYYTYDYLRLLI